MQQPASSIPTWTPRQVVQATLFVVAVGLAFWLLFRFRAVVFILFVAIVLGTAIRPAVDWLYRRNLPRAAGVIAIYLLLFALLAGVALLVAPLMVEQAAQISFDLPEYYDGLRQMLLESPSRVIGQIGARLPPQVFLLAPQGPSDDEALDRVAQFLAAAGLAARGLLATVAVFLLAFYWTLESERTIRGVLLLFSPPQREQFRELIGEIENRVGSYIRGQVLLSASIGVMALVAYALIGLPYTLVLAIVAGIMEAVPIFGPLLGAIPAILVALSAAPSMVIWILLATAAIQVLENYLLVPRIMNRSVGVNPIVTLLALLAFGSLLGLPGALLAIPSAAILQLLLDRFVLNAHGRERQVLAGRDQLSLLRYEAQGLAQDVRKQLRHKEDLADQVSDQIEDEIETIATRLDHLLEQVEQREAAM